MVEYCKIMTGYACFLLSEYSIRLGFKKEDTFSSVDSICELLKKHHLGLMKIAGNDLCLTGMYVIAI